MTGKPHSRRISLDQLRQGYRLYHQASGSKQSTIDTVRLVLDDLARHLPKEAMADVGAITPGHLNAWAADMVERGLADATRALRINKVRAFFNWAVREDFIPESPADGLKMPKNTWQPDPFTVDELKRIVAASKIGRTVHRDTAIIALLIDTGIRASELCNMPIEAVDVGSGQIHVIGKGDKPRTVIMGNASKTAMWRWLTVRPQSEHPNVFLARTGRPLHRFTLAQQIKRIGERAGVSPCYAHRFRHTFAVMYLRNGGDAYSLQFLLGHSSMDVTRQYVKLAAVDVAKMYRSPLDNL